jgi:acetyl-CoA carboxylase carboxyl transferase subunit alpha
LWKDGSRADEAAEQLKITAPHLLRLGIVDEVVPEPPGGAHQDYELMATRVDEALSRSLDLLDNMSPQELAQHRYDRFRQLGQYATA